LTKIPASSPGNAITSRENAASRVRIYERVFVQSEQWRCQYSSAYVAASITWLR